MEDRSVARLVCYVWVRAYTRAGRVVVWALMWHCVCCPRRCIGGCGVAGGDDWHRGVGTRGWNPVGRLDACTPDCWHEMGRCVHAGAVLKG